MKTNKFFRPYFSNPCRWLQQTAPAGITAFLLIILFSFNAYSQTEGWVWAQNAGGIFNEAAGRGITTDPSGHVLVAGSYSCPQLTFGNITIVNNGGDDMFLVKFDSSGNVIWAHTAGDDYADAAYGVATDANGNVYVTGQFWSPTVTFGNYTLTNSGAGDVFLVKYDADGIVQWAKNAQANDEDYSNGVATDSSGNVYITGSFLSNSISFGGIILTNSQNTTEDLFIAKYDTDGNVLWAINPQGTSRDQGFGINSDVNGDLYVSGNFRSPQLNFGNNVILTNSGFDDMFIVKYDSNGTALWAHNASGFGGDYSFAVATDPAGNVYTSGQFGSSPLTFGNITLFNSGSDDIFVAKYNSSGTVQWANSGGGFGYDYCEGMGVNEDGDVFLAGWFGSSSMSFGNVILTNNANSQTDFYLVKYETSGIPMWAKNDESCQDARAYNCTAGPSGSAYVTGLFGGGQMVLDTITITPAAGSFDMFVVKYGLLNCTNVFYEDADADGYGNSDMPAIACTAPSGYVVDSSDCDDSNALVHPGGIEIVGNGIDEDCNGSDGKPTGISSISGGTTLYLIYPNPTNDKFTLDLLLDEKISVEARVEITDLFGKVIYAENALLKKGQLLREISFNPSIAHGMYLVKVVVRDHVYSQKIFFQK